MGKKIMLDMSGASAEMVAATATFATIKPLHEKLTVIAMLITAVSGQMDEDPVTVATKLVEVIAATEEEAIHGKSVRNKPTN